jgi:hypothetical protein
MEREVTIEELIALMNKSQNEFIIHVNIGMEEVEDAKEEE